MYKKHACKHLLLLFIKLRSSLINTNVVTYPSALTDMRVQCVVPLTTMACKLFALPSLVLILFYSLFNALLCHDLFIL